MVPAHEPFRFTQPLQPAKVKEGDKIILECELSHNKDVTWLRGRGRCQVGSHYEVISVGMRRTLIIMGTFMIAAGRFGPKFLGCRAVIKGHFRCTMER